jgi:hypothetical protein
MASMDASGDYTWTTGCDASTGWVSDVATLCGSGLLRNSSSYPSAPPAWNSTPLTWSDGSGPDTSSISWDVGIDSAIDLDDTRLCVPVETGITGKAMAPLWDSIVELDRSALSRLTRVVRDWAFIEETTPVIFMGPGSGKTATFVDLVSAGRHRLLKRRRGKNFWAWYREWQQIARALADGGQELRGRDLLGLLKRALRGRRSRRQARPPRTQLSSAGLLVRLAGSIRPHAPPLPPLAKTLTT